MNKKLLAEFRKEFGNKRLTPLEATQQYILWLEAQLLIERENEQSMPNYKLIKEAFKLLGLTEKKGSLNEPLIIEMFAVSGFDWIKTDSTAWCAAFLNYVAAKAGLEMTYKVNARSWLDVGEPVELENLLLGDVVTLWRVRPSDWRGHVGIFIKQDKHHVWLLGGNQGDKVQISRYEKKRFLGGRRLRPRA